MINYKRTIFQNHHSLRILFFICFIVCLHFSSNSQSIENVKAISKDELIIVSYDLNDEKLDRSYTIYLHISKDDFTYPVRMVRGDVGPGVKAGKNKRIEWLAKEELGSYKGEIVVEVRASPPAPKYKPLKLLSLNNSSYKSGKPILIEWEHGDPDSQVTINLLENDKKVKTITTVDNSLHSYKFKLPKGKPSSYYKIELETEGTALSTNAFTITKKFPVALVAGGAGLVVIGTAVLLLSGGEDGQEALPAAPEPN